MSLKSDIEAWDGQSVEALRRIHEAHRDDPGLAPALVELMGSLRYRTAATRLFKRHFEAGIPVADPQAVARGLCAVLDKLEHWECRLDVLHCLPSLPVDAAQAEVVERFLRACLADGNRFVRAGAYSGFHWLAARHPRFADEAAGILEAGLRDEEASVRAKIRKCLEGAGDAGGADA